MLSAYVGAQKDPEETLPQIVNYRYSQTNTISAFSVSVVDSSNNNITNTILVTNSITIDNDNKIVKYYIHGGTEGLKAKITTTATFSDGTILSNSYVMIFSKLREMSKKKASEVLPYSINFQDTTPLKQNILSYTIVGYVNGVSNNSIITSSSMSNNKVFFSVGMGSVGDRMEVVLKTLCADNITLLVDRFYIDVR